MHNNPREKFSTNTAIFVGLKRRSPSRLICTAGDILLGLYTPPETAISSNRGYQRFLKKNQFTPVRSNYSFYMFLTSIFIID
jgi:hypothetical protein